jgi:hypothetical protein
MLDQCSDGQPLRNLVQRAVDGDLHTEHVNTAREDGEPNPAGLVGPRLDQATARVKSDERAKRRVAPLPPGLACATLQQMTQPSADLGPIPPARKDDSEDVVWALSTAEAMHSRGDRGDALKWLRRAAEAASEAQADDRALELAKAAADLASALGPTTNAPPPRPPRPPPSGAPSHGATTPSGAPSPDGPGAHTLFALAATTPAPSFAPPQDPPPGPLAIELVTPLLPETAAHQGTSQTVELELTPLPSRIIPPPPEDPSSDDPPSDRDTRPGNVPNIGKSTAPSAESDPWPAGALGGNDASEPPDEKTRIGVPAYEASAKLATETTSEESPPPVLSAAPHGPADSLLRPSQAMRVVVWRAVDGVHVAPQGTRVAAISVDAVLVALDPGTDLAAWLSGS